MAGEVLMIIVGFLKWLLKGCKTKLNEEIYGDKRSTINTRGRNYLLGILILLIIILITVFVL